VSRAADLAQLTGYPFEVRYSDGARTRAVAAADLAGDAYGYFRDLFSGVKPDIALVVANETDWASRQPYGLAFFNDDGSQIRPGVVQMPGLRNCWRLIQIAAAEWTCNRSEGKIMLRLRPPLLA